MHYGQKDRRTALCVAVGSFAGGLSVYQDWRRANGTPLGIYDRKAGGITGEISD